MAANGQQGTLQQQSGPQQVATSNNNVQQMTQVQQQTTVSPQQIQLQQTTAQNIHNAQQHQSNQGQTMQQVQLVPQAQYNLQNLLNQGLIFNPNMNPSFQVIKPIQNQFTHMIQPGGTSYAIPTSGGNNSMSQYIIGNFSQTSPLQIQQQQGKPGEMAKVINAQLPQQLWPQTFLTTTGGQNSFLIRGTHPEQMYIQSQMTANATSQQFSMQPIQTGTTQLQNAAQVQQTIQQGNLQQQQQQAQSQTHTIQTQANVVSIKTPANLQPKPAPLQIQPNTQQATHQIQQQHQIQSPFQLTMTQQNHQQIQMIPHSSAASIIPQSISISQSQPQTLTTTQVLQQAQQQQAQNLNQARHLTILPHSGTQNQSIQIIQQPGQVIRQNFSSGMTVVTSQPQVSQGTVTNGVQIPQPRQKIRKSTVTRVGSTTTTILQPPRPGTTIAAQSPQQNKQFQPAVQQGQTHQVSTTLTRIPVVTTSQNLQQSQQKVPHLQTINISAIHPNLPDATITPLNPQTSQHQTSTSGQLIPQTLQVYTTVPSPNISITPAPPPPQMMQKKEETKETKSEIKAEPEKENNLKSTPINGTSNGDEEVPGKQKLQKQKLAMVVKPQQPQVLTHVIEGFVIQEAAEPFPMPKNVENDEPPKKKSAMNGEIGKCEMCGKVDLKAKFKKGKRFCSSQCAKGMKAAQQQAQATLTVTSQGNHTIEKQKKSRSRKWGDGMDENLTDETNSSVGEASANEDHHMEVDEGRVNPVKWGVSEVVDFVRNLPGCSEYAEDFALQEIDGQALLLLKADHLMTAMSMKLGPALKLCAKIENLRAGTSGSNNEGNTSGKPSSLTEEETGETPNTNESECVDLYRMVTKKRRIAHVLCFGGKNRSYCACSYPMVGKTQLFTSFIIPALASDKSGRVNLLGYCVWNSATVQFAMDLEEDENHIRIRPLVDFCDNFGPPEGCCEAVESCEAPEGEGEVEENEEQEQESDKNLPFSCSLCKTRFQKKLFLNNHMERRHGIKFVFTEKGKKVKLIRMPQELTFGEKLDPCVEALLQQNGQNASNVLGVQPVELKKLEQACPAAHEIDPYDLLQGKREFGAAILVKKIRTFAMKKAQERNQTPFIGYRPLLSKRLYLLKIHPLNDSMQLLLPATEDDLECCEGLEKESSFYLTHLPVNPESQGQDPLDLPHNSEKVVVKKPCTRFSNVAIVALAAQMLDDDTNKILIHLSSPPSIGPMSLIKSLHFSRTIIQCQPKRLRCLSITTKSNARRISDEVDTSRQKRRITHRHSDLDDDEFDIYPEPKKRGRKRKIPEVSDEETSITEDKPEPKRRGRKPKNRELAASDDEEDSSKIKTPPSEPKKRGRKPKIPKRNDEEETQVIEVKHEPKKRGRKPKIREISDEEGPRIKTPPSEPKKRGRPRKPETSDDEGSTTGSSESSEYRPTAGDRVVTSRRKLKYKRRQLKIKKEKSEPTTRGRKLKNPETSDEEELETEC